MEHSIADFESGSVVHLDVGDSLEVTLPREDGESWQLPLRPRGLVVIHASTTPTGHRLRFRADFGVGGLVRFERAGSEDAEHIDLCVTVSPGVNVPSQR